MTAIETFEHDGWTATVYYDEDPGSPADWTNVGTLAYQTRDASVNEDDLPSDRYDIGRFTDDCPECEGGGERETTSGDMIPCARCNGGGYLSDGHEIAKRLRGAVVTLPVYAWDGYLGTELRIADDWEQANGWIYATEASLKDTGVTLEDAAEAMRQELATWQQWAQGDVYGYVVTDPSGEVRESIWGFYGLDEVIAEAKSALESELDHEASQARAVARMMHN